MNYYCYVTSSFQADEVKTNNTYVNVERFIEMLLNKEGNKKGNDSIGKDGCISYPRAIIYDLFGQNMIAPLWRNKNDP